MHNKASPVTVFKLLFVLVHPTALLRVLLLSGVLDFTCSVTEWSQFSVCKLFIFSFMHSVPVDYRDMGSHVPRTLSDAVTGQHARVQESLLPPGVGD